jgi:hypothetical protein
MAAIIVFAAFWIFVGRNLSFEVGSFTNNEYAFSHSEEFSEQGKLIITLFISILSATLVTGFVFLIRILSFRSPSPIKN